MKHWKKNVCEILDHRSEKNEVNLIILLCIVVNTFFFKKRAFSMITGNVHIEES